MEKCYYGNTKCLVLQLVQLRECDWPWAGSSHTAGVIIRQDSFPHRGGEERQATHFHKLPQHSLCSAISCSCWAKYPTFYRDFIYYPKIIKVSIIIGEYQKCRQKMWLFCLNSVLIPNHMESISFALPLPMMTKGVLATLRMEMASETALCSAKLTGGGGQHDTSLEERKSASQLELHNW